MGPKPDELQGPRETASAPSEPIIQVSQRRSRKARGWSRTKERDGVGDEVVIGEPDEDPGIVQSCRPRAANKLQGGQKALVDFLGASSGSEGERETAPVRIWAPEWR